jgi:cytochrome c oxidase subunit II
MRGAKSTFLALGAALVLLITLTVMYDGLAIAAEQEQVIDITAKKFSYSPSTITVKKGIPVVLQFKSLDRMHGFYCPGLDIRTDIMPLDVTRLRFVPLKAGKFPFHCDNFCGEGHERMTGEIIVTE